MRILFLTEIPDPGVGSSVRQMYSLAKELRGQGHQTAVVSTVRNAADATPTVILDTPVFRIHSDYNVRWRGWVSLHNRAIDGPLQAILDEWRPDVVHAHLVHTHLGYHALTQARRSGAGVVFTAHDVMTFCYQKLTCFHGGEERGGQDFDVVARSSKCIPCQRLRFRPGRNRAIASVLDRDVQCFTVVSDALGEIIRANGIRVDGTVHNAIEVEQAQSAEAIAAFRKKHGLEGRDVLAMGGRLHEQKGVVKLFEMMAVLRKDFPRLALLVMGKSELYESEFRAKAEEKGVADLVVPTGWLKGAELAQAYGAADVFVTPSICFDTFGLVNLEAMEQARPVVATIFGGSAEVVQDGVTGWIANPFDVEDFAARIGTLLADPGLAQKMGKAGRRRLEEHFAISRLSSQFMQHYLQVQAGPSA